MGLKILYLKLFRGQNPTQALKIKEGQGQFFLVLVIHLNFPKTILGWSQFSYLSQKLLLSVLQGVEPIVHNQIVAMKQRLEGLLHHQDLNHLAMGLHFKLKKTYPAIIGL